MTYRERGLLTSNPERSDVMQVALFLVIPLRGAQLESGMFKARPKP